MTAAREQLMEGVPTSERRATLAGVPTLLLEGGHGPPMVLLHGPGEFAAKWLRVLPELSESWRVVAPDLPAHGESGMPEGELDAERMVAWLDALIEEACAEPPVLVGHVLGGAVAARYAIAHPGRLSRLVLVDSLGLARFRPHPMFGLTLLGMQARPSERSYNRFMRQCSRDLDGLREEMGELWNPFVACYLDYARGPNSKAVGRLLRKVGLPPIPPRDLARIATPTSLIWGRQDRANRLRVAERASARYGWPLHVVEDCADDPARDRPEAFLRALRAAVGDRPPDNSFLRQGHAISRSKHVSPQPRG